MHCIDLTSGQTIASKLIMAATFRKRLVGLMGQPRLETGEGLLIAPCKAVHTMFMRFPIDVVFLDSEGAVVKIVENLVPWRQSVYVREAHSVLELPAGWTAAMEIRPGHRLKWRI